VDPLLFRQFPLLFHQKHLLNRILACEASSALQFYRLFPLENYLVLFLTVGSCLYSRNEQIKSKLPFLEVLFREKLYNFSLIFLTLLILNILLTSAKAKRQCPPDIKRTKYGNGIWKNMGNLHIIKAHQTLNVVLNILRVFILLLIPKFLPRVPFLPLTHVLPYGELESLVAYFLRINI
jgi:hypothetical protein